MAEIPEVTSPSKKSLNPLILLRALKLIRVEPLIFLQMLVLLTSQLVFNDTILDRSCRVNLNYSSVVCDALAARETENYTEEETAVQKSVALTTTWRFAINYSAPAILVLILGSWSDVHGRKFPLLLVMVGNMLKDAGLMLALHFRTWDSTTLALLYTLPASLSGNYPLFSMAFHSYLADNTANEHFTLRFGIASVFSTAGVSLGTKFAAFLISDVELGFSNIIWIVLGIQLVAIIATVIFIRDRKKEVCTDETQTAKVSPFTGLFNWRHLFYAFKTVLVKRKSHGRLKLILLLLAFFCASAPFYGESSFLYLFLRYKFGWDAGQFGDFSLYQTVAGAVGVIVSILLLSYWFEIQDAFIGFAGCISQISSCFMYAFAETTTMIYFAPVVDILNGAMTVTSRSMVTKTVDPDEQGKIISVMAALDCVNPLIANTMYSGLYAATLETFPGSPFLLSAGMSVPPIIVFSAFSILIMKNRKRLSNKNKGT